MNAGALLSQLRASGVRVSSNGDKLKIEAPAGAINPDLMVAIREQKSQLIDALSSLDYWLTRVRQAGGRQEMFDILDEFRSLSWTDEDRAQMSRTYVRRLESVVEVDDGNSQKRRTQE